MSSSTWKNRWKKIKPNIHWRASKDLQDEGFRPPIDVFFTFPASLFEWQLFPFIMKHFGARASDARCSLRDYALQRAFLGLGALQPAWKRAAACVFWQRSVVAGWGALQRALVRCSARNIKGARCSVPWCAAARGTLRGRAAAPISCAAAHVFGARSCSALQRMLCAAACASPALWSSLRAVAYEGALQPAFLQSKASSFVPQNPLSHPLFIDSQVRQIFFFSSCKIIQVGIYLYFL